MSEEDSYQTWNGIGSFIKRNGAWIFAVLAAFVIALVAAIVL